MKKKSRKQNKLFGLLEEDVSLSECLLFFFLCPFLIFSKKTSIEDKIKIVFIYGGAIIMGLWLKQFVIL